MTYDAVAGATRTVYWNIGPVWPMYVLLAVALAICAWGVYRRARLWRGVGEPGLALEQAAARWRKLLRQLATHERFLRDPVAGWMHAALMASMLLLLAGTTVVMVHVDFGLPIMQGRFYLVFQKLVLNIAGVVLALACVLALARRYLLKVPRLQPNRPGAAADASHLLSLLFLLVLVLQGFGLQAIRLAAKPDAFAAWSPVGHLLSLPLSGMEPAGLIRAYQVLWWSHLVTALAWIAWLPYGKMLHVVTAPLAIYGADPSPRPRVPQAIDFDNAQHLGTSKLSHFSAKDLLDLEACTSCGRCQQACPAFASGAPLSPRNLILDLRDRLRKEDAGLLPRGEDAQLPAEPGSGLAGNAVSEEALWACTTCAACMQECPVHIEHVPKIVGMRRHLAMEASQLPPTLQDALVSLENRGHPHKGASGDRTEWSRGLDVPLATGPGEFDVLYWVGCTASFDPRSQKVARSLVELLKLAAVRVAVLGNDEPCCGDPARRIGHEFLYDTQAKASIELLQSLKPQRIVTACPHCFNALGKEYRQLGGEFEVVHHTQLLDELVAQGRLAVPAGADGKVTYHDPCYLGRYGGEYEAPRELIDAAGAQRVEMERSRSASMCCGGGGGQVWMPSPTGAKTIPINQIRARQAVDTGAETLAVGCPFCMKMMEDGVKAVGAAEVLPVKDVAEILLEAVRPRDGGIAAAAAPRPTQESGSLGSLAHDQ